MILCDTLALIAHWPHPLMGTLILIDSWAQWPHPPWGRSLWWEEVEMMPGERFFSVVVQFLWWTYKSFCNMICIFSNMCKSLLIATTTWEEQIHFQNCVSFWSSATEPGEFWEWWVRKFWEICTECYKCFFTNRYTACFPSFEGQDYMFMWLHVLS